MNNQVSAAIPGLARKYSPAPAGTQPHRAILLTANQPGVKKWPGMKLHYYDTHIPHSTPQHTPHGTTVSLKAEVKVVGGDDKVGPRLDQPGVEGEGRWQCRTKHFRAT